MHPNQKLYPCLRPLCKQGIGDFSKNSDSWKLVNILKFGILLLLDYQAQDYRVLQISISMPSQPGGAADPMDMSHHYHRRNYESLIDPVEKKVPFAKNGKEARKSIELICRLFQTADRYFCVKVWPEIQENEEDQKENQAKFVKQCCQGELAGCREAIFLMEKTSFSAQ